MTEKEKMFVTKFNEMLKAAKEMEMEGIYTTSFQATLVSSANHDLDRQKLILELDHAFLENGFRLVR